MKVFRHIGIYFCVVLVFVASTSLTWEGHYCKDELKTFSLIGKAETCQMGSEDSECKMKKKCPLHNNKKKKDGLNEKDCCSTFQAESSGQSFEENLEVITHVEVAVIKMSYFDLAIKNRSEQLIRLDYLNRPPPLIEDDLHSFFQVYII